MYLRAIVPALALATALSYAALAQDPPAPGSGPAVFCNQPYALCIKAACAPVVTRNSDGTYAVTEANCTCDVLTGWSMGPGACDTRAPQKADNRTYLISTYSNFYNKTNLTLKCPDSTLWAWCYGAPCVVDEKDPSKATCTCPVQVSKAFTLGGSCREASCRGIWSAASEAENTFANNHFYQYMTEHNLQPPPNPPAKPCPNPQPIDRMEKE